MLCKQAIFVCKMSKYWITVYLLICWGGGWAWVLILSPCIERLFAVRWQLQLFCKVGFCDVGFVCLANVLQCGLGY